MMLAALAAGRFLTPRQSNTTIWSSTFNMASTGVPKPLKMLKKTNSTVLLECRTDDACAFEVICLHSDGRESSTRWPEYSWNDCEMGKFMLKSFGQWWTTQTRFGPQMLRVGKFKQINETAGTERESLVMDFLVSAALVNTDEAYLRHRCAELASAGYRISGNFNIVKSQESVWVGSLP
jgi:hypothetical protein